MSQIENVQIAELVFVRLDHVVIKMKITNIIATSVGQKDKKMKQVNVSIVKHHLKQSGRITDSQNQKDQVNGKYQNIKTAVIAGKVEDTNMEITEQQYMGGQNE